MTTGWALELIDEVARYLGIGIATAVAIIDPGLVVLGERWILEVPGVASGNDSWRQFPPSSSNAPSPMSLKEPELSLLPWVATRAISRAGIARADFENRAD